MCLCLCAAFPRATPMLLCWEFLFCYGCIRLRPPSSERQYSSQARERDLVRESERTTGSVCERAQAFPVQLTTPSAFVGRQFEPRSARRRTLSVPTLSYRARDEHFISSSSSFHFPHKHKSNKNLRPALRRITFSIPIAKNKCKKEKKQEKENKEFFSAFSTEI